MSLRSELNTTVRFCSWAVLIGPLAQILLWAAVEGSSVTWQRFLKGYLVILVHFICYAPLFGAAVLLLRSRVVSRTWVSIGIGSVSLAVVASSSAVTILIASGIKTAADRPKSLLVSTCVGLAMTALALAAEWTYRSMVTSRIEAQQRILERERATRAAAEAQWNSLESRLHPHFLFNTLSSIRELMHRDVAEADIMIQRFSNLIRFSLDSSRNRLVTLAEELETVSQYLQIEKIRLGARLSYNMAVPAEHSTLHVPSLSVLTLVENSVKHAIACRRSGGHLEIKARAEREQVRIEVCDDGSGFDESVISPGHGLYLLRERLQTLYPRQSASLLLPAAQRPVVVSLLIPAALSMHLPSPAPAYDYEQTSQLSR